MASNYLSWNSNPTQLVTVKNGNVQSRDKEIGTDKKKTVLQKLHGQTMLKCTAYRINKDPRPLPNLYKFYNMSR